MGSVDRVDDRTFKVNLTGDSLVKLRDSVGEKLKEFMGDYTDDTLVEYVIVLLKNGRRKEEAKNELNVFLGDDSDSFVSWLWDHLASNTDLHVQPQDSSMEDASKRKSVSGDEMGKSDSHHLGSAADKVKSNKSSRSRHNREWRGLARDAAEPAPFLSSELGDIQVEEKSHNKVSRAKSPSLQPAAQRKRIRPDERQHPKREVASQVNVDDPRRLLQFAVRDALTTSRQSNSTTEPTLKRLRSVVSTSTGDSSLVDPPRRLQSVARVPSSMATVMRAVAEAAEDVTRVKSSGSVFDRLGRGMDVLETSGPHASFREAVTEDVGYEEIYDQTRSTYLQRSQYSGQYVGNTLLDSEIGLPSDSFSDIEGCDEVNVKGHRVANVSQTGTSIGNEADNSLLVQYGVAKNGDDLRRSLNKDQGQPTAPANNSHKIVNISVNVNTWKPPHYLEPREVPMLDDWKSVQDIDADAPNSDNVHLMKESSNLAPVSNGNANHAADSQKALPSSTDRAGLYAAGCPLEDADSRTIFVSNVHFAATKDSLSRHFNKFGEVLKVVILTDAEPGQTKGLAYVEFMRKEAADNALSLDGTSFMSWILKVVKRSAAHQEAAAPAKNYREGIDEEKEPDGMVLSGLTHGKLGSEIFIGKISQPGDPENEPHHLSANSDDSAATLSLSNKGDVVTDMGHGTTIIVFRLSRGVVYLVDSRATDRAYFHGTRQRVKRIVSEIAEKFMVITTGVYIAGCGSGGRFHNLQEHLADSGVSEIEVLKDRAHNFLKANILPEHKAEVTALIAGWSIRKQVYVVYKVGDKLKSPEVVDSVYVAIGSGRHYAERVLESENLHIDMDVQQAMIGGRRGLLHSITKDPSSGVFLYAVHGTSTRFDRIWSRLTIIALHDFPNAMSPTFQLLVVLPDFHGRDLSAIFCNELKAYDKRRRCPRAQFLGPAGDCFSLYLLRFDTNGAADRMWDSCDIVSQSLRSRLFRVHPSHMMVGYVSECYPEFLRRARDMDDLSDIM